jgi:hypothetical protein
MRRFLLLLMGLSLTWSFWPLDPSNAWFDETHVAIAKSTGYLKWFNAVGPDMIRVKMGNREGHNHFVNNPRGTSVTADMVMGQVKNYNKVDPHAHLYGAIIASVRDYIKTKKEGKYAEYHLAFSAHYVGDLSQPLHNIEHDAFNQKYHRDIDGVVNDEVLDNLDKIEIYHIRIGSDEDLAREVAKIANLSLTLGYKLEDENRILTKEEAYQQISHSASLFKGILEYVNGGNQSRKGDYPSQD